MEAIIKNTNIKINLDKVGTQSGCFVKNQLINFIKDSHTCLGENISVSVQEDQNKLQSISICGKIKIIKDIQNMKPNTNELILQQLEKINNKISSIETKIDDMDKRITVIETKIDHMDKRITVLETKITVIESKIDSINDEICEIKNRLTKIENCPTIKKELQILNQ